MTQRKSLGFEFHLGNTDLASIKPAETGGPFRILVVGDFSGRSSRRIVEPVAGRRPIPINIGALETILQTLEPQLRFPLGATGDVPVEFRPASLEDFHPDRLFANLDLLARMRDLRARLANASGFLDAMRELQLLVGAPELLDAAPPSPVSTPQSSATSTETADRTLERLLGRPSISRETPGSSIPGSLLKEIVAPYIVREPHPRQAGMLQAFDAVIGQVMRAVLHHPAFRELEANWRGLDFLARNLELSDQLQVLALDVSRAELAADLSGEDLSRSGLYQILVRDTVLTPGGVPWAVVTGCYTFGPTSGDAELVARLGMLCRAAGAPFVAGADYPSFTNPDEAAKRDDELWQAVRRLPEASNVGLVAPRFLLRLPYGPQTNPITTFNFEEQLVPPEPTRYLWGNPAFACTLLLGQSFSQSGWGMRPGELQEIEGIWLDVYKDAGESKVTPPAEIWLSDDAAENLLDAGLMPLQSIRDRDAVRLMRFQSIGAARALLAGRWSC
jgi:type VI secretion system protein ImpC